MREKNRKKEQVKIEIKRGGKESRERESGEKRRGVGEINNEKEKERE